MWTRKNVYLLKIRAKSSRDWSMDIWKDTESNLGPFAAFKGESIQKQALFSFRWIIIALYYPVCSVFSFVLFSSPPSLSFRLNHVRKVRKRCSHSRFSSGAIILRFFDRNVCLCCSCFFGCCGRPWQLRREKKILIDLFTDTAAILNSEEIMGCPGGRWEIIKKNTVAW